MLTKLATTDGKNKDVVISKDDFSGKVMIRVDELAQNRAENEENATKLLKLNYQLKTLNQVYQTTTKRFAKQLSN
ncbi:hypothetical protein [Vibrio lentus]|uniref:hypothetical protein n=1 Tax=Vibrio lentus TaxID=136468 RepID=UPI000977B366|nr:hypothetical protein [Vibrio lentus]OMO26044.1 hypothetical protein BH583_21045 [Vibrio lentus]PMN09423.1 hypothetical protein BCT38_09260 [Vibrio lentus]